MVNVNCLISLSMYAVENVSFVGKSNALGIEKCFTRIYVKVIEETISYGV